LPLLGDEAAPGRRAFAGASSFRRGLAPFIATGLLAQPVIMQNTLIMQFPPAGNCM